MKALRKVLSILLSLFLIILLTLVSLVFYSKYIKKDSFVNVFGYTYFKVLSNSMYPKLEVGDTVVIKLNDDFKVNDIITYTEGNTFITHRVVKINNSEVVTKGDNNNTNDIPIRKSDVIGVVVYIRK